MKIFTAKNMCSFVFRGQHKHMHNTNLYTCGHCHVIQAHRLSLGRRMQPRTWGNTWSSACSRRLRPWRVTPTAFRNQTHTQYLRRIGRRCRWFQLLAVPWIHLRRPVIYWQVDRTQGTAVRHTTAPGRCCYRRHGWRNRGRGCQYSCSKGRIGRDPLDWSEFLDRALARSQAGPHCGAS